MADWVAALAAEEARRLVRTAAGLVQPGDSQIVDYFHAREHLAD